MILLSIAICLLVVHALIKPSVDFDRKNNQIIIYYWWFRARKTCVLK